MAHVVTSPNKFVVETAVAAIWSGGNHDRRLLKLHRELVNDDGDWASILWGFLIKDILHAEDFKLQQLVWRGVFDAPNRNGSSPTAESAHPCNLRVWREHFKELQDTKVFGHVEDPKQALHEVSLLRRLFDSPVSFEYETKTDINIIAHLFTLKNDGDPWLPKWECYRLMNLRSKVLTMKSARQMKW